MKCPFPIFNAKIMNLCTFLSYNIENKYGMLFQPFISSNVGSDEKYIMSKFLSIKLLKKKIRQNVI